MPVGEGTLGFDEMGTAVPSILVTLKLGVSPQKYGLVIVRNGDGTLNRQFKITGAAYAALTQAGAGAPPGVTTEEWTTGLAVAAGKDYDVGDCAVLVDGSVPMKVAAQVVGIPIAYEERFLRFRPNEFTGTPPRVTVAPSVIAGLDQTGKTVHVDSIINGEVAWR